MDIREKIKLQLSDDFFKEEVRCNHKVTEKTKKIWAIELDLLNELIKICQKHDIKMCVSCGTLLGAIRHKGMIPWDDDIDVSMTREEYDKLCIIAPLEFKFPYFFQNCDTDPQYLFGYSRLRNSLTTARIIGHESPKYNNGIYIDIFVMDGYADDVKCIKWQLRKKRILEITSNIYNHNVYSKDPIKRVLKNVVVPIFSPILHTIIDYSSIKEFFIRNQKRYNNETNRVSLISHNMDFITKYWCLKKDLLDITYIPFENIMVPAPVNYDDILSHMYGNYMEFPPINKRGAWHEGTIEFDPDTPYKDVVL